MMRSRSLLAAMAAAVAAAGWSDPVFGSPTPPSAGPSYPIARKGNGQAKVRRAAAKRRRRQAAKR